MISWPPSLPQGFTVGSVEVKLKSNVIQTAMDVGPAKRRRRDTVKEYSVSGGMVMSAEQFETFEIFFEDTLGGGVLSFDWFNPIKRTSPMTFSFDHSDNSFSISPIDPMGKWLSISMKMNMVESDA